MPQDNPRTETRHTETRHTETRPTEQQRGGSSARSEQMRGENMAAAETFTAQIGDMGKRGIDAGLRMQTEMFDALQTISRDWVTCTTSEAELALNLPHRLAGARSIPEAMTAYQEWLSEWLTMCNEDGRRLVADGQKFMATSVRCFTGVSPGAPN
jgi:hypothetical protein